MVGRVSWDGCPTRQQKLQLKMLLGRTRTKAFISAGFSDANRMIDIT
jgi:hypothetical protein